MSRTDTERLAYLAGCGMDCGPVVEGFSHVDDDFHRLLTDVVAERIGIDNIHVDTEETDADKLEAFRRLIDAAMEAEQ